MAAEIPDLFHKLPTDCRKLLVELEKLENFLLFQLLDNFHTSLIDAGWVVAGGGFRVGQKTYIMLDHSFIQDNRTLRFGFVDIANKHRLSRLTRLLPLSGKIRYFECIFPEQYAKAFERPFIRACEMIEQSYGQLERHFLLHYSNAVRAMLTHLHTMVRKHFALHHKDALCDFCVLTITRRNLLNFRYSLDYGNVTTILKNFKARDIPRYSPVELTLALIFGEAEHTINILNRDDKVGNFLFLPTSKFYSANHNYRFFVAEAAVLENAELAEYTIHADSEHIFQIGVPRRLRQEVEPVFEAMTEELATAFVDNMRLFNKMLRAFKPVISRGLDSWDTKIGNLVGSAAAALIKGLSRGS
jgi:hypothetical protein